LVVAGLFGLIFLVDAWNEAGHWCRGDTWESVDRSSWIHGCLGMFAG
jgi:hypothetical protein